MMTQAACYVPGVQREPAFDGDFTFNTGRIKSITDIDYIIFSLSLVIPTIVGSYQGWRSRMHIEIEEFMMAGGTMGFIPVGLSLISSFLSAITMIGAPTEVYSHSIMNLWSALGFVIVCAASAHIYMPVFYELRVKSVYQYLEMRFSRAVRTVAFGVFALHMTIYMALVLYIPSVALSAVTGLNLWGAVVSVTLVCIFYCTFGGIRAVIWADCFHVFMMFSTVMFSLYGASEAVGTRDMLESVTRTNRIRFFDFRLNPTVRSTAWSSCFGGGGIFLALYAVNQVSVHRCLTCRTLKDAKLAMWICFPGYFLFLLLSICVGLYMSAFYENCDPLQAKLVKHSNEIPPLFMQDILSHTPGFLGIYLAGVFSATLSTVSSGINSVAMVFLEDYIRVYFRARTKEEKHRMMIQIFSVIFGFICMELSFLASKMGPGILQVGLTNHACLSGPLLGLFSLGMFFPKSNEKGALIGVFGAMMLTTSMIFMLPTAPDPDIPMKCVSNCNVTSLSNISKIALLQPHTTTAPAIPENSIIIYNVSYLWFSMVSSISCVIIGLIASYMTGYGNPKDVDPRLIVPLFDDVFPFYHLPESTREYFRCGIDHKDKFEKARRKMKISPSSPLERVSTDESFIFKTFSSSGFQPSKSAGTSEGTGELLTAESEI